MIEVGMTDNRAIGSAFVLCPHGNNAPDCGVCLHLGDKSQEIVDGVNGAGVPVSKLSHPGTGAAMHRERYKLNVRKPTAIAQAFKRAGLDWQTDFALAIKAAGDYAVPLRVRNAAKQRIQLWLRLLPYLVTGTRNTAKPRRWKGKASKAALLALEALEGKDKI